ncbi:MAG: hypothetical protein LBR28_04915 [Bacteroidales bacterium]|jgi:hypothetical protein|nr:hypothetical protein [Bacteroidales bacterium]
MKKILIIIAIIAISLTTMAQENCKINELTFSNEQMDNSLKFNFIAPLTGYTSFSFEKYLKPGLNWEVGVGFIGFGLNNQKERNPYGANISAGLKIFHQNRISKSFWNNSYIMPELQISIYNERQYNYYVYPNERRNVCAVALMATFGKEVIYRNLFLVDWFFSIGYSYSTTGYDDYYFGFLGGGEEFPISFMGGLKIGYIFGNKK